MLTSTKKRYMFIIYELGNNGRSVRGTDIARALNVKKASVSLMIPNLVNLGLVSRTEDGRIDLTKHGTVYANDLYVKYLPLYKFFKEKLNSSDENARTDAICCLCSLTDENTNSITEYILTDAT